MSPTFDLDQAYKTIKNLISEEKWADAHRACLEFLRFDPENLRVIHYKNKIENAVKKINRKAIKQDLKKLKTLKQQQKYEEYLKNLKNLEPYLEDYPKLKNIILDAQKKYQKQLHAEQEIIYKTEIEKAQKLSSEGKYQDALLVTEHLRILDIHKKNLQNVIEAIRNDWINKEMEENKVLTSSQKYENILFFYQRLLQIDPLSQKVKSAIAATKRAYQEYRIEEKKEFIYKSLEQIRTLYQLKKYEKALQACGEILEIDPQNALAKSFQKKSARKTSRLIDNEVITQMINNRKKLEQEYRSNPKDFDRIF